jgi:hypothetical protein
LIVVWRPGCRQRELDSMRSGKLRGGRRLEGLKRPGGGVGFKRSGSGGGSLEPDGLRRSSRSSKRIK